MSEQQPKNPLHSITLEQIVNSLVKHYGWEQLSSLVDSQCFSIDPSVRSSLKFLRKNISERKKVENLYISTQKDIRQ